MLTGYGRLANSVTMTVSDRSYFLSTITETGGESLTATASMEGAETLTGTEVASYSVTTTLSVPSLLGFSVSSVETASSMVPLTDTDQTATDYPTTVESTTATTTESCVLVTGSVTAALTASDHTTLTHTNINNGATDSSSSAANDIETKQV